MDDNSEDEFEENFGELDDEIVPDLEAVHEELIENRLRFFRLRQTVKNNNICHQLVLV